MEKVINWSSKPGPKKKDRVSTQISVTIPPAISDMLTRYMEANGLKNRSGTVAKLIEAALSR